MACKGFWECLLKFLNFLLVIAGLAMIGYGVYLFSEYKNAASPSDDEPLAPTSMGFITLGRPMLMAVHLSDNIYDKLPKAWFIYLFTGLGAAILLTACCGCIGTATRNGCCLSCYSVLVILLILGELAAAAFIFFDKSWKEDIPTDKTGDFDRIYEFLKGHWNIIKWVAIGIVALEASAFLLALIVRAANMPADYDSDEDIGVPRQQIRQPLISRSSAPPTGIAAAGALDQRPSRNDAWSTRMREKYGLDTSEFTYDPSEQQRYAQSAPHLVEERSRCTIM